jgi:aminoglycoside phosphotransferase (APT) family kinase protein
MTGAESKWHDFSSFLSGLYTDWSDVRITEWVELPGGWETEVFRLQISCQIEGREEKPSKVLRLFPGPAGDERARNEFEVMRLVAAHSLPLPGVDGLVTAKSPLAVPFILMEYIDGLQLRNALEGASQATLSTALERMASILARLHSLDVPTVLPNGSRLRARWESGGGEPQQVLVAMRDTVARFHLGGFDPVVMLLEQSLDRVHGLPTRVLHNDFHPENVLKRKGDGRFVVLDWSFADVGDPRLDLAWCALLVGTMLGKPARRMFLDHYAAGGGSTDDLDVFELLKLSDRLATLATWLEGYVPSPIPRITPEAMRGDYRVHILNVYDRYLEMTGDPLPTFEAL